MSGPQTTESPPTRTLSGRQFQGLADQFTDGFGRWTRPGPIIKPVSATVFSPDGAPDNPQDAGLAIDGNPNTAWSTVTYRDAVPFPKFINVWLQDPTPAQSLF